MQPPTVRDTHLRSAPSFLVMERQPVRPAAIVLAMFLAAGALGLIAFGLAHSHAAQLRDSSANTSRQPSQKSSSSPEDAEDDDPSQVDVIALGDAADAPMPAQRRGRSGNVHATILIHLPRFGSQAGLIPDTASGHQLYGWLAAFNQANAAGLEALLPNEAASLVTEAQMQLRRQTGGFRLLSAQQIEPGILVFRLRDQTPLSTEVLGTMRVDLTTHPPSILGISLRDVPAPAAKQP